MSPATHKLYQTIKLTDRFSECRYGQGTPMTKAPIKLVFKEPMKSPPESRREGKTPSTPKKRPLSLSDM